MISKSYLEVIKMEVTTNQGKHAFMKGNDIPIILVALPFIYVREKHPQFEERPTSVKV